jgi:dihydrodiol dehydrogenase / D-xylose 1-dehydrogenase (NADP)
MKKINWAILAPGKMASKFATALKGVADAHLYSVASRNVTRARAFADLYDFETVAPSYDALMADPKVDVIYIASPHTLHAEQSIDCLKSGKAVLCEKPMTINADQATRVFDAAQANQSFYMEAVWTRFMPMLIKVRDIIDSGRIGEVQTAQASFGINVPFSPHHRLYDPQLAGGALLDVGIYTITFAQWLMQTAPVQITAAAQLGPTGVDQRTGLILRYPQGQVATLNASINSISNHEAWIFGSKGSIKMSSFWQCEEIAVMFDGETEIVTMPHRINGYEGEIEEVQRCLNANKIQSELFPWSESLIVMNIMDEARKQIGLRYPSEGKR